MNNDLLEHIMGIIAHAGEAKSEAYEAIHLARQGEFEQAQTRMLAANTASVQAHEFQTQLLTSEANNEDIPLSLLMIHAQDHLMTAMTYKDIADELISVYKLVHKQL